MSGMVLPHSKSWPDGSPNAQVKHGPFDRGDKGASMHGLSFSVGGDAPNQAASRSVF
jgi:hypothetical protein